MRRLAVVPDYDAGTGLGPCVHTYAQSAIGLLGAHWYLPDVEAFFEEWGVSESGPDAQSMSHGLVVVAERRTIFFETRSVA